MNRRTGYFVFLLFSFSFIYIYLYLVYIVWAWRKKRKKKADGLYYDDYDCLCVSMWALALSRPEIKEQEGDICARLFSLFFFRMRERGGLYVDTGTERERQRTHRKSVLYKIGVGTTIFWSETLCLFIPFSTRLCLSVSLYCCPVLGLVFIIISLFLCSLHIVYSNYSTCYYIPWTGISSYSDVMDYFSTFCCPSSSPSWTFSMSGEWWRQRPT